MDTLGKLLGTPARVKIMRLFLLNPDLVIDDVEIARRAKTDKSATRKELKFLLGIRLLTKRTFRKEVVSKGHSSKGQRKKKTKKAIGWFLKDDFSYKEALKNLLTMDNFLKKGEMVKRFRVVGKIKLLVAAGVFLQDKNSRVDLMIVGDNLNRRAIDEIIKEIEAELGQELRYAVFETKEFLYRLGMYDKLIRDILDYPHERLIDSRELSTQAF